MGSDKVKILGSWSSPFVARIVIAFKIKGVEYELVEENIMCKSELLVESNPVYKKIPVLIHGDRPMCESLVSVQYIDEVWASGPSILPSDPYDRAMARFWSAYIDDKLFRAFKAMLLAEGEEAKRAATEKTNQVLALLEDAFTKCSKGHKFFGGDMIGFLDISLGCFLAWERAIQKWATVSLIDESKTPNLCKWAQDFSADAAVKDVLPDTDKLLEFAKIFVPKLKASRKNCR